MYVHCDIDRVPTTWDPPVGRRVEVDCRAEGRALGVEQTCFEAATGQVGCLLDPIVACEIGAAQGCASERAAVTCTSFQSGGTSDGPYADAFPCPGTTTCVDDGAGGQCVE